jgi:hypothetical protein
MIYIDQDLPVSVNFMKFFPTNWRSYLPKNAGSSFFNILTAMPVLSILNRRAIPSVVSFPSDAFSFGSYNVTPAGTGGESLKNLTHFANYQGGKIVPVLEPFTDFVMPGDSSSAFYAPVNGEFAAVGLAWTSNGLSGLCDAATHFPAIMNYLASLEGDNRSYTVNTVSLAGFTTYQ